MFKIGGQDSTRKDLEERQNPEDLVFRLSLNYPNPFNPSTTISYSIPKAAEVHLAVYDYLGREVDILVDGYTSEGRHEVSFDGSGLSSGIYFYTLRSGKNIATNKFVLMK